MKLRNYAYVGDAVWELFVREHTMLRSGNSLELHKMTTDRVKAGFQAELLRWLEEDVGELSDEEKDLARRGRNLHVPVGRRSNQTEYRQSTAFETLIGWWYVNDKGRLEYFLKKLEEKIE